MTSPAELQAIREHDVRDFTSTKCYVAGSAPIECRQDRRTLLALYDAQSDEVRRLREALLGIEVVEHGADATKEVWFLLRSDGDKIGAGSVHLTGLFAEAMSLWAAKRRAALGSQP